MLYAFHECLIFNMSNICGMRPPAKECSSTTLRNMLWEI